MPDITILEQDLTSAGAAAAETNVVFIPGFANTNFNYHIFTVSGVEPTKSTPGAITSADATSSNIHTLTTGLTYPNYACNTVDKKTWRCDDIGGTETAAEYSWEPCATYIAPTSENEPVLCSTLSEFESNFGKKPYKFIDDDLGDVSDIFTSTTYPSLPKGDKYFYKEGNYEKSYIYAKELINAGLPVVYYNVSLRYSSTSIPTAYQPTIYYANSTAADTIVAANFMQAYTLYPQYYNSKSGQFAALLYKRSKRSKSPTILSDRSTTQNLAILAALFGTRTEGQSYSGIEDGAQLTLRMNSWVPEQPATEVKNWVVVSDAAYTYGIDATVAQLQSTYSDTAMETLFDFGEDTSFDSSLFCVNDSVILTFSVNENSVYVQTISFTPSSSEPTGDTYYVGANYTGTAPAAIGDCKNLGYTTQETLDIISNLGLSAESTETPRLGEYICVSIYATALKQDPTVKYLYSQLKNIYFPSETSSLSVEDTQKAVLTDKGEISIKYITSGAYPTYEAVGANQSASGSPYDATTNMIYLAAYRGDAVAIIDHANNPERDLGTANQLSVYYHAKRRDSDTDNGFGVNSDTYLTYATMFTPWATYTCIKAPTDASQVYLMPASFGYLMALAESIRTNADWLAIAGVNRGIPSNILELNTVQKLTNTVADAYQPRDNRALNALTYVKPYGYTIYGNRTLVGNSEGNLTASSFLSTRNLVSEIKKTAYSTAKSLLFEQDNAVMWNKFKIAMSEILDRMVTGYGLSGYSVYRADNKYNGDPLGKGEVAAVIKIIPIYSVETFEIAVVMSDEISVD